MSTPQLIPMVAPDGSVGEIPSDQVTKALSAGGRLGVKVRSPQGDIGIIPRDNIVQAIQSGAHVEQDSAAYAIKNPSTPIEQEDSTMGGLSRIPRNLWGGAKAIASAATQQGNPVDNIVRELVVKPSVESMQHVGDVAAANGKTGTNLEKAGQAIAAVPVVGPWVMGTEGQPGLAERHSAGGILAEALGTQLAGEGLGAGAVKGAEKVADVSMPGGEIVRDTRKTVAPSIEELTGTTPQRISELQSLPKRVDQIRQTVVSAEKAAHDAASQAFPKFDQPIEIGRAKETVDTGLVDAGGNPITREVEHVQTTTFKDLQEQRSNLLQDIAREKLAVARGAAPRFDLKRMYGELRGLDETMTKAALDQGGEAGVRQLESARQQYAKYMNDFHNTGSPLRSILEAKPGETQRVMFTFLRADAGARALETLRSNGVDTGPIESLLGSGDRPLRVAIAEQAKLRKAGNPDAYTDQRLKESLSQAQYNELPSSAQARLPAAAMKSKWPSVISEIPGANVVNPRRITEYRLKKALRERNE